MAHCRIYYIGKYIDEPIFNDIMGLDYGNISPDDYDEWTHGTLQMKLGFDYATEFDGLLDLNGNYTNRLKKDEINWDSKNLFFPSEIILEREYPNGNYQLIMKDSSTKLYEDNHYDYETIEDIKKLIMDDETIVCFDCHI